MLNLIVRLSRSLPLVIALIILAIVLYFVISYLRSPMKAKEMLVKVFLVLCSAISVFFILASLYAVLDGNEPVLELAASFAGVGVVGLLITLICRAVFLKHHPHYRAKLTGKAKIEK